MERIHDTALDVLEKLGVGELERLSTWRAAGLLDQRPMRAGNARW
jgi:hypothetical protein